MKTPRSLVCDGRLRRGVGGRLLASARAFTLVELLIVISIMGILAGIAVPAIKNLGKSNVQMSASRQLLDDIGRARQLALSQHTTVYMLFVPPEYWNYQTLAMNQLRATTNLCDKQFTGYTFVSMRSVGDQPGQGVPHYLAAWQTLPDGSFIATNKFNQTYWPTFNFSQSSPYYSGYNSYPIKNNGGVSYPVNSFNYTTNLPFPVETNFNAYLSLPYVAFNYRGQLTVRLASGDEIPAAQDEYIPLAQGIVHYAMTPDKTLIFGPPDATENPPGNSTNSMFTLVHIDRLTGRATLVQQKVQ